MPGRRNASKTAAALLLLCLLGACGEGGAARDGQAGPSAAAPRGTASEPAALLEAPSGAPRGPAQAPDALTGEAALAALRADVAAIAARPEHTDTVVEVSHILVSPAGAPRVQVKDRTPEQAEQLAAELLSRVKAGEDFESVRVSNTNDRGPPIYKLMAGPRPTGGAYSRHQMAKGFGDVAWRLAIGEIGVAPFDAQASPFGWHIIQRVK
jgi:hypothetical protein